MDDAEKIRQWTLKAEKEYGLSEEQIQKVINEAEKQHRLKAELPRCGTPKRLTDVLKPTRESIEIGHYRGK